MDLQQKQQRLKTILQENSYILPSYQLYGGYAGFQDYGILGVRLKNNLIQEWRKFFISDQENVYEIETPNIMTYNMLKASGHVDRFTDFIVNDDNGNCYRADHLAKNWFTEHNMKNLADQVDSFDKQKLEFYINKYEMIKGPFDKDSNKNLPVKVLVKNLMFEVAPANTTNSTQNKVDFLRPEIAQGIILNFKSCQQFLQKEASFGIAQIGRSYRKEISPRPFTRMREFWQAEIEYFTDPKNKYHPLYETIKDISIPLLTQEMQLQENYNPLKIKIEDALSNGLVNNQLLAYYLGKIYLFVTKIGLKEDKIRLRQHLPSEMAHYATECWDLDALVDGEWLECIGCADRGSYDLQGHANSTSVSLKSKRILETPITQKVLKIKPDLKKISQRYKELTQKIAKHFNNLSQSEIKEIQQTMQKENESIYIYIDNSVCVLTKDLIKIEEDINKIYYEEYYPHIIEPSFGIDRLIYATLEQNFWSRKEDSNRTVLSLPYFLAPYDVAVFQLSKNEKLNNKVDSIVKLLRDNNFNCYTDNSSVGIGKKYVRCDEIGIKFAITVDFDSLNDEKVTIRDRDKMKQVRIDINDIVETLSLMLDKQIF